MPQLHLHSRIPTSAEEFLVAPTSPPTLATKRRPRRTRTKNINTAPALVASKLRRNEIDLNRGVMAVVCPDCNTWCPITGYAGRNPKLVPHEAVFVNKKEDTSEVRQCERGSNRRIVLDLPRPHWQRGLAEAVHETSARRATTVVPRPKAAPAPAVSQIQTPVLNFEAVRGAHLAHRARCAACQGRNYCTDGLRLADLYVRLLRQDPERSRRRELLAEVTAEQEQQTARQFPRARAREWKRVDLAVQRTDTARELRPAGAERDNHTKVPQEPPRIAV